MQVNGAIAIVHYLHRFCGQVAGVLDTQLETLLRQPDRAAAGRVGLLLRDGNYQTLANIDQIRVGQIVDLQQPILGVTPKRAAIADRLSPDLTT